MKMTLEDKIDLLIWLQLHPGARQSEVDGWYLAEKGPEPLGGPFFEIRAYHAPTRREETFRADMLSPKFWGMSADGILIRQRFLTEESLRDEVAA